MDGLELLQPAGGSSTATTTAPRDEQAARRDEERLFCAACGGLVTLGRWRIAMNGSHQHTVFNPAGVVFTIQCFRDALGAAPIGASSDEFTWFKGYAWRVTVCAACGTHLGWHYEGEALPPVFYGFIKSRLTSGRPGRGRDR